MKRILILLTTVTVSLSACSQSDGQKWLNAARKGNVKAMYQTAVRYFGGMDGIAKNMDKALFWAEKAGNQGNVDAMMLAGHIYDDLKTKKFESKRIYWFQKAAEEGEIEGMKRLISSYSELESHLSLKEEKRKCIEQKIYWNNCILRSPLIDNKSEYETMKRIYEKQLNELDPITIKQDPLENTSQNQRSPNNEKDYKTTTASRQTDNDAPIISTTINKSEVFFSRAEAKGTDVEIVCWLNPRINGTRMEAMSVKYELDGKLTSKQSRVSGYGGKELPRDGNVLNRGNRVNHGEKFFVTATIKNVAYLHSLNSVYIRVWTSYGEGDVIIKDVKW